MGMMKPLYGKSVEYYEKKKAKALKVIEENNYIVKICEEEIAKAKAN